MSEENKMPDEIFVMKFCRDGKAVASLYYTENNQFQYHSDAIVQKLRDEVEQHKQRLLTLAKLAWEARYENEDSEPAINVAGLAAEINSGNFDGIDTAMQTQLKGEK